MPHHTYRIIDSLDSHVMHAGLSGTAARTLCSRLHGWGHRCHIIDENAPERGAVWPFRDEYPDMLDLLD